MSDTSYVNQISAECLLNICQMSDTSYVNQISAECLSNVQQRAVEMPNVSQISDNYVRHLLCQQNTRRMSGLAFVTGRLL